MPKQLYPTGGNVSPKNHFTPSLCAENKLNLSPKQLAEINGAFIHQLCLAGFSSTRDMRILTTIFDQTIGYDKREDDMNGTRLYQLTGIHSDHANAAVRHLESLNIIITRKGHYGKWMSVNFDFENWGKDCPESKTNNPFCLVS